LSDFNSRAYIAYGIESIVCNSIHKYVNITYLSRSQLR